MWECEIHGNGQIGEAGVLGVERASDDVRGGSSSLLLALIVYELQGVIEIAMRRSQQQR